VMRRMQQRRGRRRRHHAASAAAPIELHHRTLAWRTDRGRVIRAA
jgi:hypothetical protein